MPRSREEHSVDFAMPVDDEAFDRTLCLWHAVRINPMHHRHLSSAIEKRAQPRGSGGGGGGGDKSGPAAGGGGASNGVGGAAVG